MRSRTLMTVLTAALAGISMAAIAAQHVDGASTTRPGFYGAPAPTAAALRVIRLGDDASWINVNQNETVRIERGKQAFTWTFSTWTTHSFDLARVAPAGFLAPGTVQVYLQPDPRYTN